MAYPTSINLKETSSLIGMTAPVLGTYVQGSGNGALPALSVSQLAGDTTQRFVLGTIVRFKDETYGEIEAVYLKGVASTAAGDFVIFDPKAGTTTRSVAASGGPGAVALHPVVAAQYGLYAVRGIVPVSTTAAVINEELAVTATPGQLTQANETLDTPGNIVGMIAKSAQDGPGAGFTDCLLSEPWVHV